MFSNRLVLFYAAALAFLSVASCSKQSDDEEAAGTGSVPNNVFGTGSTGSTLTPGAGSTTSVTPGSPSDPALVGKVTPIPPEQVQQIADNACNAWAVEPESAPAKLQLVVDISSSMNNTAPGTNMSKWEATRDALVEAICGVNGPGLGANTSVGLMFYPNMINDNVSRTPTTQDVCLNTGGITPMGVLGTNDPGTHRTLLRSRLTEAVLGRGTPTADAYDYALRNIVLSPAALLVPGDAYILLITDGIPTLQFGCYNPSGSLSNLAQGGTEVVNLIREAWSQYNVKTFAIGSPGSETERWWLSQAAWEGQTAQPGCNATNRNGPYCHMDMTEAPDFSAALAAGLQQVASAVSGCKFTIPETSVDGSQQVDINLTNPIVVYGDGHAELVGRDNANGASCQEGFYLTGAWEMELCKNTCDRFMADPQARLQLIFGCSTTEIIKNIQ